MTGNQANNLGRAFLALSRAWAPLPWSACLTSTAVAPCPVPAQRPAHSKETVDAHTRISPQTLHCPHLPALTQHQTALAWSAPPHSPGGQTSKSDGQEA